MFGRGSTHVIVRSHHPRLRQLFLVLLVIAMAAAGWQLFEFGRKQAGYDSAEARQHRDLLRNQVNDLESINSRLSGRIVLLEQSAEIDQQAYDEVTRSLTELQRELLELRQEVEFYRGIVNAEDERLSGLAIQTLHLRPDAGAGDSRGYRFRLILSQIATTNARVSGRAELMLSGMIDDEAIELTHDELMSDAGEALRFDLRHFQELRGSLSLPAGFEPARLILRLIPAGSGSAQERVFAWSDLVS